MGFYDDQVLPRALDKVLGSPRFGTLRRRALGGLSGTVLEIGFGSGPNVPHYPDTVEHVYAVDPATVGRRLAASRLAASPVEVSFVDLDGNHVELDDASVDAAVSTWTLCTVPDEVATLREIARILRPGGVLYFLEHGLSDDDRIAHRQHRMNGVQRRVGGGCNLIRDHDEALRTAGYEDIELARFTIAGPKTMTAMYAGTARRPA